MAKFKITWPDGSYEVVTQSDVETKEDYLNSHFGSAWGSAKESGVSVELIETKEPEKTKKSAAE